MTTRTPIRRRAARPLRHRRSRQVAPPVAPEPELRALDLDTLAAHWQGALDAGERALTAAAESLPPEYLKIRRGELARERQETAAMLRRVARVKGVRPEPWLSPIRLSPPTLGLPATASGCLFELDGVLSDSAVLHAWAWGEVFDSFLLALSQDTGWQFIPFDRRKDYAAYFDGRSRLEGVHAFLDSRGIRTQSAWELAQRKGETLAHALTYRGVTAVPGARRYLEASGQAGMKRAVISASASTLPMLELSGLATLVDAHIDADVIQVGQLHSPPAPDVLLAACDRLGVEPANAVTFTHTAAGVAAGLAAGLTVIGIGAERDEELLRGFGAERVVTSLGSLLDPRLLAALA